MAINLDTVPDKNPTAGAPEGTYLATVTKTEMKQPNDLNKPMYLEVGFKLKDVDGNSYNFKDRFFESDSSFILFKLTRFLKAADIQLSGSVELKDIEKLVNPGLEVVTVLTQSENEWNGQKRMQTEVDLFNSDCYYPVSKWAELTGDADDPFTETQEPQDTDNSNNY